MGRWLQPGPWLRDREGNDVFDGFGSSTVVDPVSVEQSVAGHGLLGGLSGVGRAVDSADSALRDATELSMLPSIARSGSSTVEHGVELGGRVREQGGPLPDVGGSSEASGRLRLLLGLGVVGAALYLLGPFAQLAAELLD